MLPRNHPDRIRVSFDDHRLVGNAGAAPSGHPCPAPGPAGTRRPSPQSGRRAGAGQHGGQDTDAGRFRAGGRRLHRRRRCAARRWDGPHPGRHDQGAIHPGHLPAQFSLGPRPSTGPGEPGVAGTRLAVQRRTRRLAPDHRPGLNHLRDLRDWPRKGHATTAIPASGAITRCWLSPPEPATC